jgi:oligopeptide transport system ATP-binding protein
MAVLAVRDLSVRFETREGTLRAVQGVSFELEEGQTLGLVGESGSGKSVTSLAVMGLVPSPPGVVAGGEALLAGRDLLRLTPAEMRRVRGDRIAMIFQDPMTSLNPLLTVGRQLTEVLEVHRGISGREARRKSAAALGDVGIPNPEERLDAWPHQLSGGLRQRVMIAMALLCDPAVLIADEPTTALDVTIQAQILDLLKELRERHGTAVLLITHDLGIVAGTCDAVHVMYAGRIVEKAATGALFRMPLHPYTRGLLASVPRLDRDLGVRLASIEGQPPDLAALPPGCAYEPRCALRVERCRREVPPLDRVPGAPPRPELEEGGEAPERRSACFEAERLRAPRTEAAP